MSIDNLGVTPDWAPVFISALAVGVSAIAVVLGSITQNRTLAMARRNTLTTINADRLKNWIEGIQKTLAEYIYVCYDVARCYESAMQQNRPWPSIDHRELLEKEDQLYNSLLLRLDPTKSSHKNLLNAIAELREHNNWLKAIEKRDEVVSAARSVFDYEWAEISKE